MNDVADPQQQWHWTEGGASAGPGTLDALADRVAGGRVGPDDRVWTDGMADWTPVRQVDVVARHLPRGDLGYYPAVAPLPARAAAALRGYAKPAGDVGQWPLDGDQIAQLAEAARLRRRITDLAKLLRLTAILIAVLTGLGTYGHLLMPPGRRRATAPTSVPELLLGVGLLLTVAGAFYGAAHVTLRSYRWGPIVTLVLSLLAAILAAATLGAGIAANGRVDAQQVLGSVVVLAVPVVYAIYAGRAVLAGPGYLRQPAWCQEVLIRAERRGRRQA